MTKVTENDEHRSRQNSKKLKNPHEKHDLEEDPKNLAGFTEKIKQKLKSKFKTKTMSDNKTPHIFRALNLSSQQVELIHDIKYKNITLSINNENSSMRYLQFNINSEADFWLRN